jgi:peroxiredoxin
MIFRSGVFSLAAASVFLLCAGAAAERSAGNMPAPRFDLELINGDGYLSADELFDSYRHTFILFWDSDCPHCVEVLTACEAFYREHFGEETTVVGIHTGSADRFAVRNLLEANDITFFQLLDSGGGVAQRYGVPFATPTLFLVGGDGRILGRLDDPEGDMQAALSSLLSSEAGGRPDSAESGSDSSAALAGAPPAPEWVFGGSQRIRFLGIDSRGDAAAGPYGETVEPRNDMHYRFEFEISRAINRRFRAGALLRISNEGEDVLEAGPDYLGSEWGSAFAELNAGAARLRMGYYELSMTPLTLMRWDWDDNPRTGGDAGCGCGANTGTLLVESLEELAPELTFEGALASYETGHIRTKLFYAIPRRAQEEKYVSGPAGEANRARYSLELFGLETAFQRFDERTHLSWKAGVYAAGTWENRRSVDFLRLNYPVPDPWQQSLIVSASLEIPLLPYTALTGEWIVWNRTEIDSLNKIYHDISTFEWRSGGRRFDGEGGIAGLAFSHSHNLYAKCDYLRLDGGFYSPFAALSYSPDREGIRFSGRAPLWGAGSAASIFYKRLRELRESAGSSREQESFFGASIDVDLENGAGGSIGWLDRGEWREGTSLRFDNSRRAFVLTGRYRVANGTLFQAQYQRVATRETDGDGEKESLANLYTVYLTSQF